jgi:hypothetical protein
MWWRHLRNETGSDELGLDILSRCGLNEQVGDHAILGGNNDGAISSIAIENPAGK